MLWFKPFFGHTNYVADFYGIPYHEAGSDGHGEVKGAEDGHGDDKAETGKAEHHYVFAGKPGEGALYIAPDNHVLDDAHAVPKWVKASPFIAMLGGFLMAMWFYIWNPTLPARLAENQRPLYLFLKNKWYFDELYDFLFVNPAKALGRFLWKRGDGQVIDGTLNGVAMGIVPFFTKLAGRAQSGYIFTYAFAMVIGIAVLVTWMSMSGGAH
jgi:NADH-quinone oxidoreductase subunit L